MIKWTIKKVHHWHICRDGEKFATVDDEQAANDIIRICEEMESAKNASM